MAAPLLPDTGKSAGPMKASLLDDDAFRLLAFPFSGPIPHPAYPRGVDVDGQTFSEHTDIKPGWFDARLVDWFHGADPKFGRAVLGKAVDLGRFDGKSAEPDEDGWWVTVWLKRGEERVNLVRRLAERATIYGSSETGPGLATVKAVDGTLRPWRRDITGEITAWPYLRQTLCAIAQNTYSIIRPLKATLDDYLSEGETPATGFWSDLADAMRDLGTDLRSTLGSGPGEGAAKSGRVLSRMNEEDLRAALEAARAALDRLDAVVKRQPDYSAGETP
jgi:hypothetical protein